MNNLVHLKHSDPIFDEYESFVDKGAGIKTIAFKYFGADIQKASEYLALMEWLGLLVAQSLVSH